MAWAGGLLCSASLIVVGERCAMLVTRDCSTSLGMTSCREPNRGIHLPRNLDGTVIYRCAEVPSSPEAMIGRNKFYCPTESTHSFCRHGRNTSASALAEIAAIVWPAA